MRVDDPEAAAVLEEIPDPQILAAYADDVAIQPCPIDRGKARGIERLDVDAVDLGADLRTQPANFHHGRYPLLR